MVLRWQAFQFKSNNITKQTSGALKHLEQKHNLVKRQERILQVALANRKDLFGLMVDRVEKARLETIDPQEWRAKFNKWVVMDNLSSASQF